MRSGEVWFSCVFAVLMCFVLYVIRYGCVVPCVYVVILCFSVFLVG